MRFDHWFDPYNPEHMKAYEHLCNNGCWPDGFIPECAEMSTIWIAEIQAKMSQAWLHAMKHGQIIGSAPFDT
jgi:hypothetical protein